MKKINVKVLIVGIGEYINTYVIPNIEDNFLKIALKTYVVSSTLKSDSYEKAIKQYLKNSFLAELFDIEDDYFDIEFLIDSLQSAIKECGDLKITFPAIRFVSPEEKTIYFKSNDIMDFKQVLTDIANKTENTTLK